MIPSDPDAPPEPTLYDMMMFRLFRAWAAGNPVFTRLCEGRFGITRREWRVLAFAHQHDGASPTALAQAAGLDAARTSRAITALCEKGLLARSRTVADARSVSIRLTAQGRARYAEIMPTVASLNRVLFQDLHEEEMRVLADLLARITERAQWMQHQDVVPERARRNQRGLLPLG